MSKRLGMTKQQFSIIVALGILDLLVICGLGGVVLKSSMPSAPPKTVVTRVIAIPTATRAPVPTWTPVIQQAKNINANLDEYIGKVNPLLIGMATSVSVMSDLMQQAGENAYLIQTEDWNTRMLTALISIDDYTEMIRNVSPPANVTHCHKILSDAMDKYNLVTAYLAMGLETNNSEYIKEAGKQIEAATSDMNNFNLCVNKIK